MKVAIFLVDGFEDIEAIVPIDLLRRANIHVDIVSVFNQNKVKSSHNLTIECDLLLKEIAINQYDMLILPGGPGASKYLDSLTLIKIIKQHQANHKWIAAICAAPLSLFKMGVISNHKITCYPNVIDDIQDKSIQIFDKNVIVDQLLITAKAAGSAIDFALKIIEILINQETMLKIKDSIYY